MTARAAAFEPSDGPTVTRATAVGGSPNSKAPKVPRKRLKRRENETSRFAGKASESAWQDLPRLLETLPTWASRLRHRPQKARRCLCIPKRDQLRLELLRYGLCCSLHFSNQVPISVKPIFVRTQTQGAAAAVEVKMRICRSPARAVNHSLGTLRSLFKVYFVADI